MQEQQPPPAHPTQAQTTGPKPRGRRKKIRTEPIRPICPQCEKQFSNQSALTKHKLTHSDERKFACQQCSKAFKRHDHLTGHMQTHSNRKPYNCTIQGCDKTYCDARSLRRHKENIHHIVTPREQQQQQQHQQHNNGGSGSSHSGGSTCSDNGPQIIRQTAFHGVDDQQNSFNKSLAENHTEITDLNNNSLLVVERNHHDMQTHNLASPNTTFQNNSNNNTMSTTATSTEHQSADGSTIYLTNLNTVQQSNPQLDHHNHNQNNTHQLQPSHLQPSHLLRRRIQRLHSDSGTYGCNNNDNQDLLNGRGYLACSTTSTHNLPPQTLQHGNNNHYLSNQHVSYSADYASTQHFNFDFSNMNNGHMDHAISSSSSMPLSAGSITDSGLGLNAQYEQRTPIIVTPREQQHQQHNIGGSGSSHSGGSTCSDNGPQMIRQTTFHGVDNQQNSFNKSLAENHTEITDLNNNSLLVVERNHHDMQTHNLASPNTTFQHNNNNTMSTTATSTEHQSADGSTIYLTNLNTVQQSNPQLNHHNHNQNNPHQLQPSHLLRRRIQRLHSDSGTYGCNNNDNQDLLNGRGYLACSTTSTHNLPPQTLQHGNNNHYLSNQHASYSADYASTQHFNFDFSNMNNGHMDHAISSSSSIPLSAGSVTDSGLGLNAQYEQRTPNHTNAHHYYTYTSRNVNDDDNVGDEQCSGRADCSIINRAYLLSQ